MRVAIDQGHDQACPFVPFLPRALGLLPLPWPPLEIWTELCTLTLRPALLPGLGPPAYGAETWEGAPGAAWGDPSPGGCSSL